MSVVLNHSGSVSEEMSNSSENQVESLPQSIEEKHQELVVRHVPIVSSFNERIRPLLDAVDKLRHLQVMKEGIQLPTIVVVEIVRKINDKLNASISELNRMPKILSSVGEALTTFMGIVGSAKESLNKIIVRGEYDEKRLERYPTYQLPLLRKCGRTLKFCLRNLVNKEMEEEIVQELVGRHDGAIERMLEESPAVAAKREKLNVSIKLLRESNNVLGNIMDKIASNV
ncbi:hypothetical protein D5086_006114 [Populus alba]|uniref:Uncharacterized protein n=1 Tax=Populus alba TaxID=43335 RepID=A0ACC4CK04_POPAL